MSSSLPHLKKRLPISGTYFCWDYCFPTSEMHSEHVLRPRCHQSETWEDVHNTRLPIFLPFLYYKLDSKSSIFGDDHQWSSVGQVALLCASSAAKSDSSCPNWFNISSAIRENRSAHLWIRKPLAWVPSFVSSLLYMDFGVHSSKFQIKYRVMHPQWGVV